MLKGLLSRAKAKLASETSATSGAVTLEAPPPTPASGRAPW